MATNTITIIIIIVITIVLFLNFLKSPLTGDVTQSDIISKMQQEANELKQISKNKLELARNAYELIDSKYTSPIRQYLRQPERVFLKDRGKIWNLKEPDNYIPSNTQSRIYSDFLIMTGEFKEEDFEFINSRCYLLPKWTFHQYVIVDIDGTKIPADLWYQDHKSETLDTAWGCHAVPPCNPENFICIEGDS